MNKSKSIREKFDEQSMKENSQNRNPQEEDLPPVVIPRRFSLSKSGRMKEKKRTKLSVLNITTNETIVDGGTQTTESSTKSASRESLDKAKQ